MPPQAQGAKTEAVMERVDSATISDVPECLSLVGGKVGAISSQAFQTCDSFCSIAGHVPVGSSRFLGPERPCTK